MKAYFVNNETEEVFELSAKGKKQLDKTHPNWTSYNCESNYKELYDVAAFFEEQGKKVACQGFKNVFVGLLE